MKRACLCALFALAGVLLAGRDAAAQEFSVRRVSDDAAVLDGELGAELTDPSTLLKVQLADFSALTEPGEYYLDVPGVGRSVSFRVAGDVYDGELVNVMLGFYGWRSGLDIAFERHGTRFQHVAGHLEDGLLDYVDGQVGVRKDGVGGWYDAGDYGKYLPTAAESVVTMLAAWELFSERLAKVSLPFIPEHGGELPDYLSELKWELDWLLKMQFDDGSGRVHHKLNSPRFPGFVLPVDDRSARYFAGYSAAATGELVATLAKAARAFAPYDDVTDGYSEKLLQAAQLSYAYLREHPTNDLYDDSVLRAGQYQKSAVADRWWAAAELWETTGDPEVLADIELAITPTTVFVPNFDWDTTANFAFLTYALSEREGRDPTKLARVRQALRAVANQLLVAHDQSGYGRAYHGYYWGSNGIVARTCMLLQSAYRLEPDARYLDVCAAQVGYLYGRNQYNRSHVTGSGIEPPQNPHHRPSGSDDASQPYPGLLVGGGEAALDWKDQQNDFSSNEVAINWNAALVYALAGFVQGEGALEPLGRPPLSAEACGVRVSSVGYLPDRSKTATVQQECELPSTFMCELGEGTLSGDTSGPRVLIDDLEDGDAQILPNSGRSGAWFAYDDGSGGTRTEPELQAGGRADGSAICISGAGFTEWGGGIALNLNSPTATRALYDASAYTGISFWARGLPTQFRAMVVDKYSDPAPGVCSSCFDHFQAPFTPSEEWREYTFAWEELKQQSFGDAQPNLCAKEIFALQFQWPGNTTFELCLDDLSFTTAAGTSEPTPPSATPQAMTARGGGCGCRSAGTPGGGAAVWTLLGLCAACLLVRRRRTALQ